VEELAKQWEEADKTTDPIDDFLNNIVNEELFMDLTPEFDFDILLDTDIPTNMEVDV
jgi:nucleoside-specific outer membrane channel protein Tsx